MTEAYTIPVHLSAAHFRNFANFDTFRVRKYHRNPLLFMIGMCACAVICFLARDKEQASLLGGVLLGLGLLLPAVYIARFELSVSNQIKKSGLSASPLTYTLTLSSQKNGVEIHGTHGEEPVILTWKQVFRVYRVKGGFYLYAAPQKAFILPESDIAADPEIFWAFLKKNMTDRALDRR